MTVRTDIDDAGDAASSPDALRLLELAARLLLEYNLRAARLDYQIRRLAACLGIDATIAIAYRRVTIVVRGRLIDVQAPELRVNVAVSLGTLRVIDDFCTGRLSQAEALRQLESIERTAVRHDRWLLALVFGVGASALAWLLGADAGAIAVSGISSSVGLVARQELGKRHAPLLALPFAAALIGGALGGVAIRLGWTNTAELCLVVPALMLVPGPHFINGVADVIENAMGSAVGRLVLACAILVAATFGGILGGWLVLRVLPEAGAEATPAIPLALDIALAGLAACAFGAFYNTPWRVLWISIGCGMAGHGIRWACLQGGMNLVIATLLACGAIGMMAGYASERRRLPFSAIAFAGAVPMMPGVFIYQALVGALQLSIGGEATDPALTSAAVTLFFKSSFIVISMVLGLLAGGSLMMRTRPAR